MQQGVGAARRETDEQPHMAQETGPGGAAWWEHAGQNRKRAPQREQPYSARPVAEETRTGVAPRRDRWVSGSSTRRPGPNPGVATGNGTKRIRGMGSFAVW